jgi:hypothetical protein
MSTCFDHHRLSSGQLTSQLYTNFIYTETLPPDSDHICTFISIQRQDSPQNKPRRPREGVEVQLYSFFNLGAQRHAPAALPPGKDPVPTVQEDGWASGPVWTDVENLAPTGIRSMDRPPPRQSLHRLCYYSYCT